MDIVELYNIVLSQKTTRSFRNDLTKSLGVLLELETTTQRCLEIHC